MSRQARIVIPGTPHHITQRGNQRQDVFHSVKDRELFLRLTAHYTVKFEIEILAYCLMTNHIHAVVVPKFEFSLHLAFKAIFRIYSSIKNQEMGWSGHLWQERFFSSPIDDEYLLTVVRYVETNPVRAGMIASAEDYSWSSARSHCLGVSDPLISKNSRWHKMIEQIPNWADFLDGGDGEKQRFSETRILLNKGLPVGRPAFIAQLEQKTGRVLRPQLGGRPRKSKEIG